MSESFNKFKLFNRFQLLDRFEIFDKFELINMIEYSKNWNSLTYWESNRETTINFEYSHMTLNKSNTYSKQKKINGIVYNIIYFILTYINKQNRQAQAAVPQQSKMSSSSVELVQYYYKYE